MTRIKFNCLTHKKLQSLSIFIKSTRLLHQSYAKRAKFNRIKHQNYQQQMHTPDSPGRDAVRFPKIPNKSKSVPANVKNSPSELDNVTAKSWFYITPKSQFGYKSNTKREIASLTKIMTSLCSLEICQKYNINLKTTYFKVTQWAVSTIGTTADLVENAWMTIQDLLYGLMLPSGNDAATVISENLGAVLYFDKVGNKSLIQQIRSIDLSEDYQSVRFYNLEFVNYMNNKTKILKMYKTRFANPHGLDHINNYSCCEDVYLMCRQAMKSQLFRKIVRAPTHKGTFKFFKEGKVVCRPIIWTNTNKLLEKNQIFGIKTGITNRAGGCLATAFNIDQDSQGFIVVLGSISSQMRFKDTLKVMSWAKDQDETTDTS